VARVSEAKTPITTTSAQASAQKPLFVLACLFLLTAILTVAQYSVVALVDPGILHMSDDAVLLNQVVRGLTRDTFWVIYSEHLMPGTFALYYAIYSLVGIAWPLYGSLMLAAHVMLCSLVGYTIWRFGGSLFVALVIAIPLTLSYSFGSGILIQFVNIQQHWYYSCFLVAALLLKRYLDTGSWRVYLAMLGVGVLSVLITTPGIVVIPVLGIFFGIFRLAGADWSRSLRSALRPTGRDVAVILGIVGIVAFYAGILAISVLVYNHSLPGRSVHGPPTPEPPYVRVLQAFSYGFLGLLPFPKFESNAWVPWPLTQHVAVYLISAAILTFSALIVWRLYVAIKDGDRADQVALGAALAAILVAAAYAVVATTGRKYLTYWHFRYNGTSVVFSTIAIGLALAYLLRRTPPRILPTLRIVLAVAAVGLALADVFTLRNTVMYQQRTISRYAWDNFARASWVTDSDFGFAPIDATRVLRATHTSPRVLAPNELGALVLGSPDVDQSALTRVPIRAAGRYLVFGNVSFEADPQGFRRLRLMRNGDTLLAESRVQGANGGPTNLSAMRTLDLAPGDYVELVAQHTSDRPLAVLPSAATSPSLGLVRLPDAVSLATELDDGSRTLSGLGLDVAAELHVEPGQMIPEEHTWKLRFNAPTSDPRRFETVEHHDPRITEEMFIDGGVRYSSLVAQEDGTYLVMGTIMTEAVRPGFRRATLTVNDQLTSFSRTIAREQGPARAQLAALVDVKRGDLVRIQGNFSTGTMQTAARNREHELAVPFEEAPPAARVYREKDLTVPNRQPTVVPFDGERFDTEGVHGASEQDTRLTIKTAGTYLIVANAAFKGEGRGERSAEIVQNGGEVVATTKIPGSTGEFTALSVAGVRALAPGDFLELRVSQTSGSGLALLSRTSYGPELMAVRVPPDVGSLEALVDRAGSGGLAVPAARLVRAAELAIASERQTSIPFDQRPEGADGLFVSSPDGSRITVQASGLYVLVGSLELAANKDGRRQLSILRNEQERLVVQMGSDRLRVATVARLTDGDILELAAFQNTPGSLDLLPSIGVPSGQGRADFTLVKLN
jgi:hypothetical protein